jgi:hypothetical protein
MRAGANERDITLKSHLSETMFKTPTAFSAPVRVFVSPRLYKLRQEMRSIEASALEKYFDVKSAVEEGAGGAT